MEYTKGEWRVVADPLGKFTDIFGEIGMPITTITHSGMNIGQDIANAHLIAAAPDMYEALKMALDALRALLYEHPDDDIGSAQKEVIEKALAKAEGKGE
jgi:hypothetical protein